MAFGKAAGGEADRMAAAGKAAMCSSGWEYGIRKAAGAEGARMTAAGKGYTWRRLGRWHLGRRRAARRIEWRRLGRWLCVAAAGKAVIIIPINLTVSFVIFFDDNL
jgi:hypothetical protein